MGEMCGLDWQLEVRRWRSLELLLLLLLTLMRLLMVHPGSGAVRVMRETMTSWCLMNGTHGKGLTCVVGARTLWTAGPRAREGLSLALGVLVREGRMG